MSTELMQRVRIWLMKPFRSRVLLSKVLFRPLSSATTPLGIPPDIALRSANREDLEAARTHWPADALSPTFVDSALARGDLCIGAFDRNELIAFVWRSFNVAPHTQTVEVSLQKPYWYTYKMMTLPHARGRGLGGLLTVYGDRLCQDAGCIGGVGFVETNNVESLRANAKVGARCVGYAGTIQLFGKVYTFRTPGVRPYTFKFVRRQAEPDA